MRTHQAIPKCAPLHPPWTSTRSPGSMRPLFGLTQKLFGAVVFTLNATGWWLLLATESVTLTSCVRGPAH